MKTGVMSHCALCIAVAALLAGCGALPLSLSSGQHDMLPMGAHRSPSTSSYQILYSFGRHPNPFHDLGGANPGGGLIDVGGTLYGTTEFGGYQDNGVVYSITTTGSKKVLYRFRGNQNGDGAIPAGDLIYANATFYGTTLGGRGCKTETIYSLTTGGTEKVLHNFCDSSSYGSPTGGVVDVKGTLYGTAGPNSSGIVYSVTTSGKYKVLYAFRGPPDGYQPAGNLLNVNGTLYGVTLSGGTACQPTFYGCGTVYSITTSGKERVLYSFQGGSDGLGPSAGLIDVNGTLYGVTAFGGGPPSSGCALGCGTAFSVSTSGKHKVLYRFAGGSDAARPDTSLVELNGTLYGTTAIGGAGGLGTIYSVSTSGDEQVLHSFDADGADPEADLIALKDVLYGTTYGSGGSSGCKHCGTVFALTP
ncbi:MAG: choice-of-anchor tandem repeat GloVer-containing protein [Candidatus Baltobacteraceae bacterium]